MPEQDFHYRRNLPHYHPAGYPLFITFRLTGSLPRKILAELKTQRECELKALKENASDERYKIEKKFFGRYDNWLDRCEFGPRWLEIDGIAQIVAKEICGMDRDHYQLMAYCIMPNHVHLLIESLIHGQANHQGKSANYPVSDTLRLLKGRTAHSCNLKLKRNGSFWQHESYDHYVRDEDELARIIQYILYNRSKQGW